ncbi:metal-dependent hydrolase [Candidatus Fermentibacteria bacterium]|nr:metal-dependent hydrolase [Candidatus Fermentibacteria bacterium]
MDPFTHVLAGVVVGGLFEADAAGYATAVAAAIAPDAEFVTRKIPRTAFLDYHHGLAHTIPGGAAAGLLIAALAGAVTGRGWLPFLPLAMGGVASHVILDLLMHNNGIALFAPFSRRRFSFPLVLGLNPVTASPSCRDHRYSTCIACQANGLRFNPFFWVLLAAAVASVAVPQLGSVWASLAIVVVLGISLRANQLRRTALAVAGVSDKSWRRKAFPATHSGNQWLVLQEDSKGIHAALIDAAQRRSLWRRRIEYRPAPGPVESTESLLSVRGFKNSVLFPFWSHRREGGDNHVIWQDLSYLFSEDVELYALHVRTDESGSVLHNEFNERW